MIEFLIVLAIIWLVTASISDLKKYEVPNWLSFSLIVFVLAFRAFYSVANNDLMFFVYGLLGFLVFFVLAYVFYYSRLFAGGDAKLLMGLGAVLPFSNSISSNLLISGIFIFLFLVVGSVYGLLYSGVLVFMNKNKFVNEFKKQFKLRKIFVLIGLIFSLASFVFVFYFKDVILVLLPLVIILFPVLFIYGKSVEEACMIKEIPGKKVTIGDWLYEEIKVGKKRIKPNWEGLDEKEVKLLSRVKKVKIKYGIPFIPSFLFAFILLILLKDYFLNLLLI